MTKTGNSNCKKASSSSRRPIKHKSKDKPKRPLSAYNYFFKLEREKIMKAVNCENKLHRTEIDSELNEENIENLRSRNGKIKFKEMGKTIGSRWHNVNAEDKKHYKSLAEDDKKRYADELETYNTKKEAMRQKTNAFIEHKRMNLQEQFQGPPFIQSTSSISNDYHMGYMHNYRNSNGYRQMHMMTDSNHYNMPHPTANEGHFGCNSLLQNESSNDYANDSRYFPWNEHTSATGYSQSYHYPSYPSHVHGFEPHTYRQEGTIDTSDLNVYQASQTFNGTF